MEGACKWEKFQIVTDQKELSAMFLHDSGNKIYANSSGLNKSLPRDGSGWQAQCVTTCPRFSQ